MDKTPLIVLDTNVLVSGLCRREISHSYQLLKGIQSGMVPISITQNLFTEYEAVLKRSAIRKLIGASMDEIEIILDALLAIAYQSAVYYLWRPNLTDEQDNFVFEAAVATGAMIVTKNVADFKSGELRFPEIAIMTPSQFCEGYL